jgi:hypothetical protein
MTNDYRVMLGMPGYGEQTGAAGRGFWRATRLPESRVRYEQNYGSLLAQNFNSLWCSALNEVHHGGHVEYFAMQHADIEPEDWWLDKLIQELEDRDLDVLGVVAPIKDQKGLTSIALAHESGDPWRIKQRWTMSEVFRLPATFTSEDIGHPLLLNTGLWVGRFDMKWATKVHFTINDRIAFDTVQNRYVPQVEPEDWYFSRLCHELGLKLGCTRKVRLTHRGVMAFANNYTWGDEYDKAWGASSIVPEVDADGFRFPHDVLGWLTFDEGKALWRFAEGKRVLEIGSYCGRSTICLAQSADTVHSVDPHDGRGTAEPRKTLAELRTNLGRYGVENVKAFVGTLEQSIDECQHAPSELYDLIFIDGAHDLESVRRDINECRGLLAPDGLLAFHDYRNIDPGVTQAVDELIAAGGEMLSTHDTLAVVRPPAAIPLEV